jgi:hypothetical protein
MAMSLLGLGLPLIFLPIMTASYNGIPPGKTDQASAMLNAARNTGDRAFRIGVDADRHRLSEPHVVGLRFLEVRPDPDVIGHEHREVRARLRVLAHRCTELNDTARLVCRNCRIGKVQLSLLALSFGLRQTGDGAVALRVQRLDLPLRQLERRLRTVECGLVLMQPRGLLPMAGFS